MSEASGGTRSFLSAPLCGNFPKSHAGQIADLLASFSTSLAFLLRSIFLFTIFRIDIAVVNMSNSTNSADTSSSSAPLGLPAPSDAPSSTNAPSNVIKMDHLGPMIVNSDGTISRISNWANMAEIEKERSLRLLAKRNNARMESLKNGSQT